MKRLTTLLKQQQEEGAKLDQQIAENLRLDMVSEIETTLEALCEEVVDCPHSTPVWTEQGVVVLRVRI